MDYFYDQLRTSPEIVYVIYAGIALGVFLLFTGIAQLASRGENANEAKSRRMKLIAQGASTAEVLAILKPERKTGLLSRLPFIGDLPFVLRRAGISAPPRLFLALSAFFTVAIMVVVNFFVGPIIAVLLALILGLFGPILLLKNRVKAQEKQLIAQLPDALDLMARGLRVGHPLNTSIHEVAQEMADPIGSEFGIMFDQVSFGDDLVDAFMDFAERVDLEDVHYLAASVGIQHGTGGDLARIIAILSEVVRSRIVMRRRILAISAEGRLTGIFLSLLPFAIFGATSIMSPTYYAGVKDDPMALPMALTVVGLVLANGLAIMKLVNFRI